MSPGSVPVIDFGAQWGCHQSDAAGSGRARGPALRTPEIRWRQKVGIQGYQNCPVVAGPYVFTTSARARHNKSDVEDGVYALDCDTVEERRRLALQHRRRALVDRRGAGE